MKVLRRLRALFRKGKLDADMAEEMRLHLEMQAERHRAAGLDAGKARHAAHREFGNIASFQQQAREGHGWVWLEQLGRECRFARRRLFRRPVFTAAAVLTLALCIGANTAVLCALYALILKPLPFPDPARVVELHNVFDSRILESNLVQYVDYKAHATSFDQVGLWRMKAMTLGSGDAVERITVATVTAEMFDVFGVTPLSGRFFTLENNRLGEHHVAVLTESFWEARFGRDPGAVGKTLHIDGENFLIIGVAPRAWEALDARVRLVLPLPWKASWIDPSQRYALDTALYARLRPGASCLDAETETAVLERRYYEAAPDWNKKILDRATYHVVVEPAPAMRLRAMKGPLWLLQGAVVFVLLIGCFNVANLLMAHANGREGELALRLALGATRSAIACQLLTESLLLTGLGAALGVGGAVGLLQAVNRFRETLLPATAPFAVEGWVLAVVLFSSLCIGGLLGILPMAGIPRWGRGTAVNAASPTASAGRGTRTMGGMLVTAQVAATFVLLIGAGLLGRSFLNAAAVDPGFDPEHLMTARIALGRPYWNAQGAVFQRELVRTLQEIPGVNDVALATGVPFEGGLDSRVLTVREGSGPADALQPKAYEVGVSARYFEALRVGLLEGRFFKDGDADGHEYVVDERFARAYFPGRSAVGAHFTFTNRKLPARAEDWPIIVGVVRNVPHNGADKSDTPFSYYPVLKTEPEQLNLFVRSFRPVGDVIAAVREKLHALDPGIPLYHIEEMRMAWEGSLAERRAVTSVFAALTVLALTLSSVGLYGVIAHDVSLRTRELGIRAAIGASRRQLVGLVMRQGLRWTAGGLGLGVATAGVLGRTMSHLLFALKPTDALTYGVVSLLLVGITGTACWLPARRAAKIDPVIALRAD